VQLRRQRPVLNQTESAPFLLIDTFKEVEIRETDTGKLVPFKTLSISACDAIDYYPEIICFSSVPYL